MNNDPSPADVSLDEQLVAYLDGELDPHDSRRIEELLASDPEVRRRLQSLEQTWNLLDELDTAPVGEMFTQTTLEMTTASARENVERDQAEASKRRRRRRLTIVACTLAAALIGFFAVAMLAPDPNRQLLEDLPVLENLDEYRQIEGMEFLHLLHTSGLFSAENADRPDGDASGSEGSISRRRQYVESLGPSAKARLLRRQERFAGLPLDQQQRLRQLHEQLQRDPEADALRTVISRYGEWLEGLSSSGRAELADLQPADRVQWVKKRLQAERMREGGRRPGGKDMKAIMKWANKYATRHEASFLATLPEKQRKRLAEMSPSMRHRMVFGQMWQRWRSAGFTKPPLATDEDLLQLRATLSPSLRKRLEALPPDQQWGLVARWLREGMRHPWGPRGMHGPLPKADDARLAEFFETGLTGAQRDRLLGLPGEQMQRELQRLFLLRAKPFGPPRHSSGRPKPGTRPVAPKNR